MVLENKRTYQATTSTTSWRNIINLNLTIGQCKNIIKTRLTEHFTTEWINDAKTSRTGTDCLKSAQFDCSIKHYLTLNLAHKDIAPLLKMMCGNHNLAVRTGSYWNRLEYEERICSLCNDRTIETVFHFVCECSVYNDIRLRYIPYLIDVSKQNFYGLLQRLNVGSIVKLSKYIKAANDVRTKAMLVCNHANLAVTSIDRVNTVQQ